jgi:hypothetical protein
MFIFFSFFSLSLSLSAVCTLVQIHVTIHIHTLSCSLALRDNHSPFHGAHVPIHVQAEDARREASRLAGHPPAMTVDAVEEALECRTFLSNVSPVAEQWCVSRSGKEWVLCLMSSTIYFAPSPVPPLPHLCPPPLPPRRQYSAFEVLKTNLRTDFIASLDVSLTEARARHHRCCAPSSKLTVLLFRVACGGASGPDSS